MSDPSDDPQANDLLIGSMPNAARIYDYLLGGKDNFWVDREAVQRLQKIIPEVANAARANRSFLERVVWYLVERAGIRQIIDIGAGLPTRNNVHQVAQRIAPDTRVVYVDNDPVVVNHGVAMLQMENVVMVESDLRRPWEIMTHPALVQRIDFGSPVAVLMLASLHFVADAENPHEILRLWRETMRPGSYLAISHITADAVEQSAAKEAQAVYAEASVSAVPRTLAEIESFFDGFELVPPGVVNINLWPVPAVPLGHDDRVLLYGGVGQRG